MNRQFHGRWIQPPCRTAEDAAQARLVCFRKNLSLPTAPERFPLQITAAGRYKLYVNGEFVQFGPAKGDGSVWYCDEVELSPWLHEGENRVAVSLLAYPPEGEKGNHSLFRFERPLLYLEGLPAEGWRCRIERGVSFPPEETGFAPLQIHERAVGDLRFSDWKQAAYQHDDWVEAQLCPEKELPPALLPARLQPRPIPFMERRRRSFSLPISQIPPHSEERFVLDAGEETCAFLTLETSGGRGAEIELLESEAYVLPEGKGDRCDSDNGHLEGYTDFYTVAGAERERYEPFWFRTFRFLQVTIRTAEEPLSLRALNCEETGYPLEVKTSVTTSDESLSAIWDISLRTLRRCMHETYMDCPFYEQLQYTMDTRSEILYTYAVSADDRLARQAIDDFRRAQRPDGLLNCSYPNVNVNVIPGFSIYYILMVHDHMMYFGDRELARRNLPAIGRVLDFFAAHRSADGLVDKVGGVNGQAAFWSFIDWAEPWMPTQGMPTAGLRGSITMESLLYLYGLQHAAALCAWVGDERESAYRRQAEALKTAIRAHCLDAGGMLTDGPGCGDLSQHCQVFGVLSGVLTKEEGRRNLLRTLDEPGITQCTVAMCFYLFRALEETGLYAYTDRYWDIWRRMLKNHCTTCVEGEYYPRSECHAWGALALYELPSVILGVRPAAPGYETIAVRPVPGMLRSASGTVHTPRGDLRVAWEKTDSGVALQISGDAEAIGRITAN